MNTGAGNEETKSQIFINLIWLILVPGNRRLLRHQPDLSSDLNKGQMYKKIDTKIFFL